MDPLTGTLLAGDVGGTKTFLRLVHGPDVVREARYDSQAYGDLAHMLREFLEPASIRPACSAIGVAGPVVQNRCTATNLPWVLDGDRIAADLGIASVKLINDFAAIGWGIRALVPEDFAPLNPAVPDPAGPIAFLGAGTGLGEGFLLPALGGEVVVNSEGGHADLAPRNEAEIAVLRYLLRLHQRVSVERIVSGPGIANLYHYLVYAGRKPNPAVRQAIDLGGDVGAIVSEHALAGDCALCVEAMNLFMGFYGAEAGNLALRVLPTGGVYLAGGIAAKILELLKTGPFMAAFGDK
ncbi:MAG: glucokinase, partial [Cyanobacteria bacterium REEB65]|nr:glucokinase [Cyanobacteria bacterium REEB65]